MRNEDEGDTQRPLQRLQFLLHLLAQLEVERTERLVEQQHLRLVDERAGERHALPLPTGKLARLTLAVGRQLHQFQCVFSRLNAFRLSDPLYHQAVCDVVEDIEVRKQRIVLEDGIDVAPVGRNSFSLLTEYVDMARSRLLETRDQAKAGRLAGARRAEHGEEFALPDLQVHRIDGLYRSEMARDFLKGNGWCHRALFQNQADIAARSFPASRTFPPRCGAWRDVG